MNNNTAVIEKKEEIKPSGAVKKIPAIVYSFGLLIIIIVLFQIGNRNFLSTYNLLTILDFSMVLLLVGLGQMCAILVGGNDLSVGGNMSFTSVVFVVMIEKIGVLAYPLCLLSGLVIGIINGVLLTRVKIPSFIATLGTGGILASLAMLIAPVPVNIPVDYWKYLDLITNKTLGINNTLLIGLIIFLLYYTFFKYTVTGRRIYITGSNITMAWMSGINVSRIRNIAFAICGVSAAAAGIMVSSVQFGSNPYLGESYILNSIAVVVVGGTALTGGTGGVVNTLLGALIMSVLKNGMNVVGIDQYFQQSILGVMIIISVLLTFDRTKTIVIK